MKKLLLAIFFSFIAMNLFCTDNKITLTVLDYSDENRSWPGSSVVEDKKLIWDAFEESHPDIKIEREALYGNDFHVKNLEYVYSGKMPDVFYMWSAGRSLPIFENRLAKDLTPFLEKDGIVDDYNPVCVNGDNLPGGYLAELPTSMNYNNCLFVNTAILEECGLEIPETYEELKAQVPVLEEHGYGSIIMASDSWVIDSCLFSMVVGRVAGADWAEDIKNGYSKFTDKPFLSAVKFIKQMYDDGVLSHDFLDIDYGNVVNKFADGKYAYMIDGDWRVGAFTSTDEFPGLISDEKQESDIELIVFPEIPGEILHKSNVGSLGTGYGMSSSLKSGSAKEAAAWELIKWLSGPEVQQRRFESLGIYPSIKEGVDLSEEEPLVRKRNEWYKNFDVAPTPTFDSIFDYNLVTIFDAGLFVVLKGLNTPEELCQGIQDVYDYYH